MEGEWIVGRHPVLELFRANRRPVKRVLLASGIESRKIILTIQHCANQAGVSVESVPRTELDQLASNHQGVAARTTQYPYLDLQDFLPSARPSRCPCRYLLLDGIQDPQNFGTLLRTAEIVGVSGIILPLRRGVGVTPAVTSASSGATEHLLIARANLVQAIQRLKKDDVWIYGLEDTSDAARYEQVDFEGNAALVVGGEGKGMRRLVSEQCDLLVRIPMRGRIGSLNAAVAGSIALYKIWERSGFAGIEGVAEGKSQPPV